jgi:hypothetical protein
MVATSISSVSSVIKPVLSKWKEPVIVSSCSLPRPSKGLLSHSLASRARDKRLLEHTVPLLSPLWGIKNGEFEPDAAAPAMECSSAPR